MFAFGEYHAIIAKTEQIRGSNKMKRNGLSAKQKEILEFIRAEIQAKGYPPTVR